MSDDPEPMMTEISMHTGATMHQSTVLLAISIRRRTTGWSIAPSTRMASDPRTLVAGTSENIQLESTNAKARLPCKEKT